MPKNNREIKYAKRLQVLVSDKQYQFVKHELNGGIGFHIRDMIDAYQKFHNKEITNLEKEFLEVESSYIALKKRLEDMRLEQQMLQDQQKAKNNIIETAKLKLLDIYHRYHNRTDLIPVRVLKTYSDLTGISSEDLKTWLENQE